MNRTVSWIHLLSRKLFTYPVSTSLSEIGDDPMDISESTFYFTSTFFKLVSPLLLFFVFLLLIEILSTSSGRKAKCDTMQYRSLIKTPNNDDSNGEEGKEDREDREGYEIAQSLLDLDTSRSARFKLLKKRERIIEACVSDIESALEAVRGGCNSLELCSNRKEGGTTPSHGLVAEVVRRCKLKDVCINVLIRPRPGGFNYSYAEFELIIRDILCAYQAGADGIVVGILTAEGLIDTTRMTIISEICTRKHLLLTFHRAYDICQSTPLSSIETVISLGCNRLLTSGRGKTAEEGLEIIRSLVGLTEGEGDLKIIAGSGVCLANATRVIKTGIQGIHLGSSVCSVQQDISASTVDRLTSLPLSPSSPFTKQTTTTSTSTSEEVGGRLLDMNEWSRVESSKMAEVVREALVCWKSIEIEQDESIFGLG